MATILKLSEKVKKISPRALAISICVFVFSAVIINIIPMIALYSTVKEQSISQGYLRGNAVADGGAFQVEDNERILILNEFACVTYDSSKESSLAGKYLILSEVESALCGESVGHAGINEDALETVTAVKSNAGAVYVWKKDYEKAMVLKTTQYSLLAVSLIIGFILFIIINLDALRTKKRIKTLIAGIGAKGGEPIEIEGADEFSLLAGELNKLTRQMLETEELRRTFVSDASHELRTPLSSIQLLVDSIIQTENIDMATTREFMTDVSEQIDRLSRIAERLLMLTNLDGAKDLELEAVDMKTVAESVIATLEQSAIEAQIELNCSFADNVIFKGTSDGAYQILFNLVENAIKYNRPGGSVRVYIFKSDGLCNLIVDDNGIGIPETDFELIFERFYRVDKARSRDKGGSGLGLSIVAKIVGYFNGEIKVEKSAYGGTRFIVTFPEEVEQ